VILNRQRYLRDPHVRGFVEFLSGILSGSRPIDFTVGFSRAKLPVEFENRFPGERRGSGAGGVYVVTAGTLEELFKCYWWNYTGFDGNQAILGGVLECVRAAIDGEDGPTAVALARSAVGAVMAWGFGAGTRAYEANVNWAHALGDDLVRILRNGRETLVSDQPDISVFGAGSAPNSDWVKMNAGWTKYYAMALPAHLIYDSRVGAALGFLARRYLESAAGQAAGLPCVPPSLAFRWAAGVGNGNLRDPSSTAYRFGRLGGGPGGSREWARLNIQANWILAEAIRKSGAPWCSGMDGLRRAEGALFMLGYDFSLALPAAGESGGNSLQVSLFD
jgi:hypothetical protein